MSQLTHFSIYAPFFRPYQAICSTLEESWHVLQIYPPRTFKTIRSIQHMKKVNMLSHCYRFISRPPTKHFVQHINQLGILSHDSHVWNVLFFHYNKARHWTHEQNWNLELCLEFTPTGLYTAIHSTYESSWHVESFGFTCPVPYTTYKTLCLTYEPAWHLDLCQNCPCLPLQQNNTLNTWEKKQSWVIFEIYSPSTQQSNTFKKRR